MGTVGFCSFCTQHEIARSSRSRPSLPLSLKPRQRLTPTSSTEATVLATTATDWATTAMATEFTTARGRLRPRLTLTTTVDTTAMDSATATATVLATGPTGDKLL